MELTKVDKALPSAFYVPNFISEEEESKLLQCVYAAPKPKWQQLSRRRLQMWGGVPSAKGMIIESLPSYIEPFIERLVNLGVFSEINRPNHVLINEYLPGQGIMPHEDGPYYFPIVSNFSVGSHAFLDIYRGIHRDDSDVSYENRYLFSLLLERRSLVVLTDQMYTACLHGISEKTEDIIDPQFIANFDLLSDELKTHLSCQKSSVLQRENTRVSFTIRHVPRAIKLKCPNLIF